MNFLEMYYLNHELEDAVKLAKECYLQYRVVRNGNTNYMITDDFDGNRLNFEVDNNIVTKVFVG